jgi:hypothetical protein
VTVPASYLGMPNYRRKYHALEFFFEKQMKDKWYMQGSYTLAASKGNVEGYINSTLEQTDAGITQDFDHALFEDGSYGFLPNDRRHTFKLFGVYEFTDEWRLGASFLLQSGRPINCNGYIDLFDPRIGIDFAYFGLYAGSSFYCADANGNQVAGHRGDRGRTPWIYNLDLSLGYTPEWADKKLTLEARVFNVFNTQRVTEYNENSQLGSGLSPEPDLNFLNAVNYQTPRSVEFVVRYEFGGGGSAPEPVAAPVAAPIAAPAKTCADLDDDGDGVNNCNDKCYGSPAGSAVGADGCPVPAPEPAEEPKTYRH